ncbi:hypothetical protein PRVXH_001385 [Proteinivorax hydrogeniformans]|uniref:Uncharacterized protein n=1 Tax=Proteinivorax hydrogeniformans TaxID=1826727 RepID=A0AAU8HNX0_9FIRM
MNLLALNLQEATKVLVHKEIEYELINLEDEQEADPFKWRVVKQIRRNNKLLLYIVKQR